MPWRQPVRLNITRPKNGGCRALFDPDKRRTLAALCRPTSDLPTVTAHAASCFLLPVMTRGETLDNTRHYLLLCLQSCGHIWAKPHLLMNTTHLKASILSRRSFDRITQQHTKTRPYIRTKRRVLSTSLFADGKAFPKPFFTGLCQSEWHYLSRAHTAGSCRRLHSLWKWAPAANWKHYEMKSARQPSGRENSRHRPK